MTWKLKSYLALCERLENGILDVIGMLVETHVLQHHDGAEEQRSGVSQLLSGNIRGRTVDSLKDGALVANVSGGSQAETANETGAHIGENVSVQVGHNQDFIVILGGVRGHLQACVVKKLSIELDVGVVLGNVASGA